MVKDLIVAKFGGSSLADSNQFRKVKEIIGRDENRRIVIPSAPGKRYKDDHKVTDLLYMCYQLASHGLHFDEVFDIIRTRYEEICSELELGLAIGPILDEIRENISNGGSRDYCASRGEYVNALILADYLGFEFLDARDLIRFDMNNNYDPDKSQELIRSAFDQVENAVIPGFYGADSEGNILTFPRGGSDITGAIIAGALEASLYENWTDVSGLLKADPKLVDNPLPMREVTYRELRELSYMGAPVLHDESILPVKSRGIPIQIKNTNKPDDYGTLIFSDQGSDKVAGSITGLAGRKNFTVISVEKARMISQKGFLRKLVSVFEANEINIEHMPSSMDSISIIVSDDSLKGKLPKIIEEIRIYCEPDDISYQSEMALLAVVGRGMKNTRGVSSKIFTALANEDINIRMISQGASELNILIGIENEDLDKSIRAIYGAFYGKE